MRHANSGSRPMLCVDTTWCMALNPVIAAESKYLQNLR